MHGPLSNRCAGSGKCLSLTFSVPSSPSSRSFPSHASQVRPTPAAEASTSAADASAFNVQPSSVRILRRVPRASRHLAATKLASILDEVTRKNDNASWARLCAFSSRCLLAPKRGGRRRSLASAVNAQLRDETLAPSLPASQPSRPSTPAAPRDPLSSLAKRDSAKLEEGDYKGAVRAICSEDTMVVPSEETLSALRAKHPPRHPDSNFPNQDPPLLTPLFEKEVLKAIRSFPCGSAGGPDGLRPQHLKDLTSESAERGGRELLQALSSFITHILEGRTFPVVQPFFFGATLIALRKKGGGVCPIAVGQTLHCLLAKCAGFHAVTSVGEILAPKQLGYGIPLGCEATAHAARCFLTNMYPGELLLKLDFTNAFNSLRRDKMLLSVKEHAPDLFHSVELAYKRPSSLFYGKYVIESAEGVQQGDPLGPLLFCLSIHRIVSSLKSSFAMFYLDDGTIGGSWQDVLSDLHFLELEAAKIGLVLNLSKSELICDDNHTLEVVLQEAPGLPTVSVS